MATVEAINTSNGSRTTAATEYDYASGKYVDPAADQWRDIYGQWHQPTKGLPPAAEGFAWVQGPNGAWTQTYVGDQKSLTAPTTSVHIGLGNPGSPFEFGASTRNDSIFHSSGISRDLPQEGTSQAGPATGVYGQAPGIPGVHTDPNDPGYNNPSNPGLRNRLHPEAGLIDQNANPANQRFLSSGGSGSPKFIANPGPPNYPTGGPVAGGDDLAKARSLRDALTAQSQGTQPRTAPRVAPAQFMTAPQAGNVQLGPTVMPTASLAGPAERVTAPTMDAAMAANARDVNAPMVRAASAQVPDQIGVDQVAAARIGQPILQGTAIVNPFEGAQAVNAKRIALDTTQSAQGRQQMQDLISLLQAQAEGTGPSAAQALQQKAIDQAIATQRSLAGGTRGPGHIAAALRAGQNIGQISGQGAADAAALRAREMLEGRTALGTALTALRGQDINLETEQGRLANATELQNAAMGTQTNITNTAQRTMQNVEQARLVQLAAAGNQQAQNEIRIRQAELEQQANNLTATTRLGAAQSNQNANLQTALANAGFEQGAGLANASNSLEAARANQGADLQTALANAGFRQGANQTNATLGLSALQSNQNAALQTALQNAQLGTQTNIAGAGFQSTANLTQAQLATQTALANAGFQQGTNLANASNAIEVNKTNATLGQNQMSLDDRRKADSVIAALQAQQQVLTGANDQQRNAIAIAGLQDAIKRGDQAAAKGWAEFATNITGTGIATLKTLGLFDSGSSSGTDYGNNSNYTRQFGYNSQSGAGGDFLGDDG